MEGVGLTSIFVKVQNPDIWRKHDTFMLRGLLLFGSQGSSSLGDTGSYRDDVMFYVVEKGSVLEVVPIEV